jgi:uncharacterized protein (TIGR01777 family)
LNVFKKLKVVLPGGTGQVGTILGRALIAEGHEVVCLTRSPSRKGQIPWDGATLGGWAREIDGSDVVVNLAGRSVSCRYTPENLAAMMRSRVDSARVVGEAIAAAARPPAVWMQMSTATIYAHRFDAANDEHTGLIGGGEAGVPGYWAYSVEIARNWEAELERAATPATRKVALRSAMVMNPDRGGVFDVLSRLARLGLGGPVAGGRQYVSWVHLDDVVGAILFELDTEAASGPVNLTAPEPATNRELSMALGRVLRRPAFAPVPALAVRALYGEMADIVITGQRAVPARLTELGYSFRQPELEAALRDATGSRRAGA